MGNNVKRVLPNSRIYVLKIPNTLHMFLYYHGLGDYLKQSNLHGQYGALVNVIQTLLVERINDVTYMYDGDIPKDLELEKDNMYLEYISDELTMFEYVETNEVYRFVVIIKDLIEKVYDQMIYLDIYTKDFTIRDITTNNIYLEVTNVFSGFTGKENLSPLE